MTVKLDLGCDHAKQFGYVGVDLTKNGVVDVVATILFLPFKTESIDVVYSRRVIQHVQNDSEVVKEIFRVLKKKGVVNVILASWFNAFAYKIKTFGRKNKYPVFSFYTHKKLESLFSDAGFEYVLILKKRKRIVFWDYVVYAENLLGSCSECLDCSKKYFGHGNQ